MKRLTPERIIQILLLAIIAVGFTGIAIIMKPSPSGGPGRPGGNMQGARPGGGGAFGSDNVEKIAVVAQPVQRRTVSKFIRINGDVVSDVSVDIFPDAGGKLVELRVKLGTYVQKGEIIGIVDPSTPGQVYSQSTVRSTISGTVTAVKANVGDTVNLGTSIAVIGDLSNLSIITYIPERFITNIRTGLNALVNFEAFSDTDFDARVIQLNPVVDSASRSLEIKLEILDPDARIRAGMFATIRLITEERTNVLAIPTAALAVYYEDTVVFVTKEDSFVERRAVTTGLKTDDVVEITGGLKEGEQVVVQGISSLTDGTPVRVVKGLALEE